MREDKTRLNRGKDHTDRDQVQIANQTGPEQLVQLGPDMAQIEYVKTEHAEKERCLGPL